MLHRCIATGDGNTGDFNLIKIFLKETLALHLPLCPASSGMMVLPCLLSHKYKMLAEEHGLCHEGTREMHKNTHQ